MLLFRNLVGEMVRWFPRVIPAAEGKGVQAEEEGSGLSLVTKAKEVSVGALKTLCQ